MVGTCELGTPPHTGLDQSSRDKRALRKGVEGTQTGARNTRSSAALKMRALPRSGGSLRILRIQQEGFIRLGILGGRGKRNPAGEAREHMSKETNRRAVRSRPLSFRGPLPARRPGVRRASPLPGWLRLGVCPDPWRRAGEAGSLCLVLRGVVSSPRSS